MFDGPEHASYIALCRELRLERELRDGDFVALPYAGREVHVCGVSVAPGVMEHGGVWLPRLDQWLAMLEAAGADAVALISSGGSYIVKAHAAEADGPTREEAAARLWLAVTGRAERG